MAHKLLIGVGLGLAVGAGAALLGIPSPAPPALIGALLVVAMTLGYEAAGRWLERSARGAHAGMRPSSLDVLGKDPP